MINDEEARQLIMTMVVVYPNMQVNDNIINSISDGFVQNKERKRVWIDSQTEEEILRGIKEAKDWSEYDNLSASAYLRAKEDYLMGINFSRALTLKYANRAKNIKTVITRNVLNAQYHISNYVKKLLDVMESGVQYKSNELNSQINDLTQNNTENYKVLYDNKYKQSNKFQRNSKICSIRKRHFSSKDFKKYGQNYKSNG